MQGGSNGASSGAAVRRAFARSRYEVAYLQQVYDLLLQLQDRRPKDAAFVVGDGSHYGCPDSRAENRQGRKS